MTYSCKHSEMMLWRRWCRYWPTRTHNDITEQFRQSVNLDLRYLSVDNPSSIEVKTYIQKTLLIVSPKCLKTLILYEKASHLPFTHKTDTRDRDKVCGNYLRVPLRLNSKQKLALEFDKISSTKATKKSAWTQRKRLCQSVRGWVTNEQKLKPLQHLKGVKSLWYM